MITKPIIEYFPDGAMTEYRFNNGVLEQWTCDGLHKPYFSHNFDTYLPSD